MHLSLPREINYTKPLLSAILRTINLIEGDRLSDIYYYQII